MKDLKGKKILVLKLRYIGDTLSLIPVIENLNQKVSDLSVDVMVNRGTEEVLAHHPGIRKLWIYDRSKAKKNIISSIFYHSNLIRDMRCEKYDVVIDFTHGDRAAFISFLTGASERISYRQSSSLSLLLMNRLINEDPREHHIVDYQLHALRAWGLDHFSRSATLYIPEAVQSRIDALLAESGMGRNSPKVVIHPGARGKLRQWAPARFAEIARRFREYYHAEILLIGGPKEGDLVEEVQSGMGFSTALKTTRLSLLEMGALMRRCRLFFGNDSAPGHIAAAVGCPTLVLFGPTFPHMWRPIGPAGEVIFKNVPCCGCRQEVCIRPENTCMDLITVEEVWQKAKSMLGKVSPPRHKDTK